LFHIYFIFFVRKNTKSYDPGSFIVVPPGRKHFVKLRMYSTHIQK
jgi:quercetin dioxygenase-like cupin family protein